MQTTLHFQFLFFSEEHNFLPKGRSSETVGARATLSAKGMVLVPISMDRLKMKVKVKSLSPV